MSDYQRLVAEKQILEEQIRLVRIIEVRGHLKTLNSSKKSPKALKELEDRLSEELRVLHQQRCLMQIQHDKVDAILDRISVYLPEMD